MAREALKAAAARRAVAEIEAGMIVGLGSGSTVAHAIAALGERVGAGLAVAAIPSSEHSAILARRAGVPLTSFAAHRRVDLAIDGADQIERGTLHLVKGAGGALWREKIIAASSARFIVIADATKLVDRLGGKTPLPVAIARFAHETVLARLADAGYAPRLRRAAGEPFVTDDDNHIADCAIAEIVDPAALEARLAAIIGVVESGLFVGLASQAFIGRADGVEIIDARAPARR